MVNLTLLILTMSSTKKLNNLKYSRGLTLCKPPQVNSYVDLTLLMELVCSWQVIPQLKQTTCLVREKMTNT